MGAPRTQMGLRLSWGHSSDVEKEAWEIPRKGTSDCSAFGFPKIEPCGRNKWLEPILLRCFEKRNLVWAKSEKPPIEILAFLVHHHSFWIPASVGWSPNCYSTDSHDFLCNPALAPFPV